jgi:hypothetical protein
MATFLTNLWDAVFTPGTTPTLLLATNITFAALQLLLLVLLVATYSIHFAILSVLCSGLWWSINWFATELRAAQAKEAEAEAIRKRKKEKGKEWRRKGEVGDSADDEGEDTEVEESRGVDIRRKEEDDGRVRQEIREAMVEDRQRKQGSGTASGAEQATAGAEARQRKLDDVDRSGEVSTDSEWERVSQEGDQ